MRRESEFQEYLKRRDFKRINRPAVAMQFLYNADEFYRFRGAEALGSLCRGSVAKNFILRLFWHLSDESGAHCIGAPLGIAEIGRTNPEVFEGFKNKYVSLIDDWEVEKRYVIYGIGRLGKIVEDAYPSPTEKIIRILEEEKNPEVLAYAVKTSAELRCLKCRGPIKRIIGSRKIVRIYDGEMREVVLGEFARLNLERLDEL